MGKASSVFISGLLILSLMNVFYLLSNPDSSWSMTVGFLSGLVASAIATGVIAGINLFGSGLSSASVKIVFGVSTLLNLLFQIEIQGAEIGTGLANNIIDIFSPYTASFLGLMSYLIVTVLSLTILASGLIIMQGGE